MEAEPDKIPRTRGILRRTKNLSCYTLILLSSLLLEESARESFFPHPLHVKTVCSSFRQSASRPRRISSSPHRHSSAILFEQVTKCSGNGSETDCIGHPLSRNPHRAALSVIIVTHPEHGQVPCAFVPCWCRKHVNRERGVAKVRLEAETGRDLRRNGDSPTGWLDSPYCLEVGHWLVSIDGRGLRGMRASHREILAKLKKLHDLKDQGKV